LKGLDRFQRGAEAAANRGAGAMSSYQQKAFELMTSTATKDAFDIAREPDALREEYGRHSLGQSCLMARRLVEAGVRCVLIDHTNWDTHYDNFNVLKNDLLPHLDSGMTTLFRDLHERGMLDSTLVLVTGEFGRTPRIGGGGIQGGRVIGASDERAEKPATTPYGPEDLAATIFHCLGIDPKTEFLTPEGRPIPIVPGTGRLIEGLT
jgi:uncharacterized protein (DUF1501 family)